MGWTKGRNSVDRGSRRLLNDLFAFGRLYDARPSALERLQQEVGTAMMHKLFEPVDGQSPARSTGRRRHVA